MLPIFLLNGDAVCAQHRAGCAGGRLALYLRALDWSAVAISVLLRAALMSGVVLTLRTTQRPWRSEAISLCLRGGSSHCRCCCTGLRATLASLCCF
jgi:hypothetical protein